MDEHHVIVAEGSQARAVAMDSLTHVNDAFGPEDVLIGASFLGVLTADWVVPYRPRAVIGHDCGVGLRGAGIAGLWYLDGRRVPAATVSHRSARVGDGLSLWETGCLSHVNHWAAHLGCTEDMSVEEAVGVLTDWDGHLPESGGVRERRVPVHITEEGSVVAMDSIRFAQKSDRDRNVVCVGSHGGVTAGRYALNARPLGFISNDGGIGRDRAGVAGLAMLDEASIPGAAAAVASAEIGSGLSTYVEGIVSTVNEAAARLDILPGWRVRDAAHRMLERHE